MVKTTTECKKLADISSLKSIMLPPFSVFVGNECPQHAGAQNLKHSSLQTHSHLVPRDILRWTALYMGGAEACLLPGQERGTAQTNVQLKLTVVSLRRTIWSSLSTNVVNKYRLYVTSTLYAF